MNVIELVTKYLPILDEQYRALTRSAILDMPTEFVRETNNAKKVLLAKIRVDKLANYSRNGGFVKGSADLTWEEHTFTQDRGRAIQIDEMDNEESFRMAFGRLAGTFTKEAVIPEVDAYRFSTYYKNAYTKMDIDVTASGILSAVDELDATLDDYEVDEANRILFVTPTVYKLMINDPQLSKHITIDDNFDKAVNKKIYMYDNHPIVKVPTSRFYTEIEYLDGQSAGQEEGGYKPAAGAKAIGLLMIQADAVVQLVKLAIARIWAPRRELAAGTDGVNPDADAWKFDYRIYHDAWVLENKVKGIAACTIKSAKVSSVTIASLTEGVEIEGNAATVQLNEHKTLKLTANVVTEGGATPNVTYTFASEDGAGFVDTNGVVTLVKTGTLTVKATSMYDPSKSNEITITVE